MALNHPQYIPLADPRETPPFKINRPIPRKPLPQFSQQISPIKTHQSPQSIDIQLDEIGLIDSSQRRSAPFSKWTKWRPSFLRWWMSEIFASILSIVSLLSVMIVLRSFDGRSIDDPDLPSWLTPNGIIAAIATLNRVCMLVPVSSCLSQEAWLWFSAKRHQQSNPSRINDLDLSDNASRGAWGSLVLLFRAKTRFLAYIGALITILSLAVGTFTQQLLAVHPVQVGKSNSALSPGNIPRSITWQSWTGNPAEGNDAWGPLLNMKAAVYNGMLTEDVSPEIATCPTGNCTWPPTPSLAVCGGCQDSNYKLHCNETICNATMQSGSVIPVANWAGDADDEGIGFAVVYSYGYHYDSRLYNRAYLANFDMFGAPYDAYGASASLSETVSAECALWICINTYDVSTTSSRQNQSVIATYAELNTIQLTEGGSGGDVFTFDSIPADIHAPSGTNFTVSMFGTEATEVWFASILNATVYLNLESQTFSNDVVEAIWNGTQNLDAWIANVAESMTNVVRTDSAANASEYNGVAFQQGYVVRWQWLSLPIAMVVSSVIFLVIVMIKTALSPVQAWKGSPLTFLLFDVDSEMKKAAAGQTQVYDGFRISIGERKTALVHQPSGTWIFSGEESQHS